MATKEELEQALRNAHAAGDTAAATKLAAELQKTAGPSRADQLQTEFDALPTYMKPVQAFDDISRYAADKLTFGGMDHIRALLGTQPDLETARQATRDAGTRGGSAADAAGVAASMIPMLAMPEVAIPATAGPVLQGAGRVGMGVLEGMGWGGVDALGHGGDVSEGQMEGAAMGAMGSAAAGIFSRGLNKIDDWWNPAPKKVAPRELRLAKDRAYNAMEDENIGFKPSVVDDLITRVDKSTKDAYPGVQEGVIAARSRAKRNLRSGGQGFRRNRSMTEIDKERQNFRRDAVNHPVKTNEGMGIDAIKTIDDWMEDAVNDPTAISSRSGDADKALGLLQEGRKLNQRVEKVDMLDERIGKAERQSDRSLYSGEDSTLKQNIGSILDNPKLREQFTPDEIEQMLVVNSGTTGQKIMRGASKMQPGKGWAWPAAAAAGGFGGMVSGGNPVVIGAAASVPGILGALAGKASSRATRKEAEKLLGMVSTGKTNKKVPMMNSKAQRELARLLTAIGITSEED